MTKEQVIADMQRAIRTAREKQAKLEAGDYSDFRYCTGAEAARYIFNNYEAVITAAERVIAANMQPEDLA